MANRDSSLLAQYHASCMQEVRLQSDVVGCANNIFGVLSKRYYASQFSYSYLVKNWRMNDEFVYNKVRRYVS